MISGVHFDNNRSNTFKNAYPLLVEVISDSWTGTGNIKNEAIVFVVSESKEVFPQNLKANLIFMRVCQKSQDWTITNTRAPKGQS